VSAAIIAMAAMFALPSPASAAPITRINSCVSTTLQVTVPADPGAGATAITASAEAIGSTRHHVSRLHLDFEIQERTVTAWVRFVTPGHAETFTNGPGARIHRTWTLREDAAPVHALLQSGVQMRIYAGFSGVCHGEVFGPPLLYGLPVAPTSAPPPLAPQPPSQEYEVITLPNGQHQTVIAHELEARISDPATVASFGGGIHATATAGVYKITVPGDLLKAQAQIAALPGVVWVTTEPLAVQ
jgi:hypothetical protein